MLLLKGGFMSISPEKAEEFMGFPRICEPLAHKKDLAKEFLRIVKALKQQFVWPMTSDDDAARGVFGSHPGCLGGSARRNYCIFLVGGRGECGFAQLGGGRRGLAQSPDALLALQGQVFGLKGMVETFHVSISTVSMISLGRILWRKVSDFLEASYDKLLDETTVFQRSGLLFLTRQGGLNHPQGHAITWVLIL